MSKPSNVRINFFYSISYQILTLLLPLITAPYIARTLGANGLGVYSYTYAIASYFVLFGMLGLNNYGNRSIAKVRDNKTVLNKTFWSIYALQFLTASLIICIYCGYILIAKPSNITIFIIQIIYVASCLFDINWFFFGMEEFKITVTRNLFVKVVSIILIFTLVNKEDDLWIYTLIMTLGTLFSQLIMWAFLKKYVFFYKPTLKDITVHFKPNITLFIPVIAVSLYKMMSKIMIGQLSDLEQVGLYESAERIITVPLAVSVALGTVMLPKISNLVEKGSKDNSQHFMYIHKSLVFSVAISVGMGFGIAAVAMDFVPIFYGAGFYDSGYLITLLSPTIVFTAWANVIRTQFLIPKGMDSPYIVSVILGAIVNISLNLVLIPPFGAFGATIGTFFAELMVCVYQTYYVRRFIPVKKYVKEVIPFILIGIMMFIFVRIISLLLETSILTLLVEITIGAIFYLLCCTILFFARYYKQQEIN